MWLGLVEQRNVGYVKKICTRIESLAKGKSSLVNASPKAASCGKPISQLSGNCKLSIPWISSRWQFSFHYSLNSAEKPCNIREELLRCNEKHYSGQKEDEWMQNPNIMNEKCQNTKCQREQNLIHLGVSGISDAPPKKKKKTLSQKVTNTCKAAPSETVQRWPFL